MKIGDYVRTKYGIAKIIDLIENPYGEKTIYVLDKTIIDIYECDGSELACCIPFVEDMQDRFDTHFGDEKCIIKSSPNIIDLIEVGDYVNGHRVVEVDLDDIDDYGNTFRYIKTEHDYSLNYWVKENEIETILTKKQFESMEYKI